MLRLHFETEFEIHCRNAQSPYPCCYAKNQLRLKRLPIGTVPIFFLRLFEDILNHAELGEKSQPVSHIPMFGYLAVLNSEYIHDIKVQFVAEAIDPNPRLYAVTGLCRIIAEDGREGQ
jgi:hypothetical protein